MIRMLPGDPIMIWENNSLWLADELAVGILNKLWYAGVASPQDYQVYYARDAIGPKQHSRIGYIQLVFSPSTAVMARLILG
jgi:hypothetical protein